MSLSSFVPERIWGYLVTFLGFILAIYVGSHVASGDTKPIAIGVGIVAAISAPLILKDKYWLLYPLLFPITGSISAIRLPFNYSELGALAVLAIFVLRLCFHKQSLGFRLGLADIVLLINFLYLATVFARNPVSMRSLGGGGGGDMIGGRNYFTLTMFLGAYFVVNHARIHPKLATNLPWMLAITSTLGGIIFVLTSTLPFTAPFIFPFWNDVDYEAYGEMARGSTSFGREAEFTRLTGLAGIARPLILLLISYFPPSRLLFPHPLLPFLLFYPSLIIIALSGFRNEIMITGAYVFIANAIRRMWLWALFFIIVPLFGIVFLAFINQGGNLVPLAAQRAFSFLPLGWNKKVVAEADGSVDWRVDMWKDALSGGFIKNKLLGDGFGFDRAAMNLIADQMQGGVGFVGGTRHEAHMIRGSFHSGPLSSIRFVGVVGLVLILCLMGAVFRLALITAFKAKGTPYFPLALFVGIPFLWLPFHFIFIFGAFDNALKSLIIGIGMLNIIGKSIVTFGNFNFDGFSKNIAPESVTFSENNVASTHI
jgi:hypothetical protein